MTEQSESMNTARSGLKYRAKELNCLFAIEECLNTPEADFDEVCQLIVEAIPPGWQYSDICQVRISLEGSVYKTTNFIEVPWCHHEQIRGIGERMGEITVCYSREMPTAFDGPFLEEEVKLIRTIAYRLGHFVQHHRLKLHYGRNKNSLERATSESRGDWRVVLDLVSRTDQTLFTRICHKMLNQLSWTGVPAAVELLEKSDLYQRSEVYDLRSQSNVPQARREYTFPTELAEETFRIASTHLGDETILYRIQKWMQEDKLGFLVRAVERNLVLSEIADAIRRYRHLVSNETDLSRPARAVVRVSLIRRFLSDQQEFIKIAKEYIRISDFHGLLQNMIYSSESQGRIGGKGAGLCLAAVILEKAKKTEPRLGEIKVPKTWYITSDMQLLFMHHNNLDDIVEQKYKDIAQIRHEYPHIVHTCKNSRFPMEFVQGLSVALDSFKDSPVIVRSSSVLEDRVGAAFSGKYKSLFVPNQGTREERLNSLFDAIAEVYASMFGPDPIEYRTERGLLDFAEEMGIMIQEVVGTKVGPYYLPLFAGVALNSNEFRWSPRIKRSDGIMRLVPGLGTRAVDRLGDDYPALFAPGQPGLRVNASVDEILRYSPQYVDAISLEKNEFVTLKVTDLVRDFGDEIPGLAKILSIHQDGHLRRPGPLEDYQNLEGTPVVTFEGLMNDADFVGQMQGILKVLHTRTGMPVDIEFAHDGKNLYLLQCRSQTYSDHAAPAVIPRDLAEGSILFSANKHVSNGEILNVTHIVYVDPERYGQLTERSQLKDVGKVVSLLNKRLPKRQFILMGPGRWGSRGDIKLGVSVTYSDINNTAALVEIARKTGSYTPDLSFGTHFFQDLVEARIRYLPLYPDEPGNAFNDRFFNTADSILSELLPEFAFLSDTVRVIDVEAAGQGRVLRIRMNADLDEAIGFLCDPTAAHDALQAPCPCVEKPREEHSSWRQAMAERIAFEIDPQRFGTRAIYLMGSTKNNTAGPSSDIDLLIHFNGSQEQRILLLSWLEGWSNCLDEMNFLRTGCRTGGLLDVRIITDEDIEKKTRWAVKIGAVTDPARALPHGKGANAG